MATRSKGMPRMRSASIPLLGFDETRMRLSRAATAAILCRDLAAQCAEAAREALPQSLRRGIAASEAFADEETQPAMDADALFAVGADADVGLEIVLFVLAEI